MPLLVQNIIHFRDYVDFFQRLEFRRDKPFYTQYLPGEGLTRLIPDDSILQFEKGIAFDAPLFNQANNLKIVETLGPNDALFLEVRSGHILSTIYVAPEDIDVDLYFGQESLIYVFYSAGSAATLTVAATLQPDVEGLYAQLTADPGDLHIRRQGINDARRSFEPVETHPTLIGGEKAIDSKFIFRPQGSKWIAAFGGEQETLDAREGFKPIHLLLQNPGKPIHCLDADRGIIDVKHHANPTSAVPVNVDQPNHDDESAPEPDLPTEMFTDIPITDQRTILDILHHQELLRKQYADAVKERDDSQATRVDKELGKIELYLKQIMGKRGIRDINPDVNKARSRVFNNTKNAINFIAGTLPELALFLHTNLIRRTYCRYDPPEGQDIPWVL